MTERQKDRYKKHSNPFAAAGRVIAFIVVAFTVCKLVKTFVCGRMCEDCPCRGDDESNDCSGQEEN